VDPLILAKLQSFAERRRRLIILRGVCAALAMLLGTMMAVALLDRFFILPDWFRWSLSGAAYAAVIVAEWRACLRLLIAEPGARRLARLIEQTAPELREDLLSAVELGEEPEHFDSAQFRQLVQSGVADRMSALDAEHLLPTQLVRRSLIIAGSLGAVLILALVVTKMQFGTMMLRAMLPGANLARVSSVKVTVLEPTPAEMAVPQGDAVPLLVETGGRPVSSAYLETFTKTGSRNLVQMTPSGRNRFSAQIQIAREDVQYRVRAGDAITRKYLLHAAARPHVVRFAKTFHYPAYAQLPDKKITEETGDLVALEKTEVELLLDTDQPVKAAELRLETGKETSAIPLETVSPQQLRARLPLIASGTYRVHLVSKESNFENKFSPEYELRAEPDLIPKVEIETPDRDTIATTSELLDLTGNASDDIGLASLEHQFRVNEGPWKSRPVPVKPGLTARMETQWDLAQEAFHAGDIVTTRLVATDRNQQRGESKPIQITIAAGGFDSRRAAALLEKQRLLSTIAALRIAGETLEKRTQDTRGASESPDEAKVKQAGIAFATVLDDYEQRAGAAISQLSIALRVAEGGHDSGHLVLLGRALSRLHASGATLRFLHQQGFGAGLEIVATREIMREAVETARFILPRVRQTEESCRIYVASEELALITENLQVAAQEQRQLADRAQRVDRETMWPAIASRSKAILAETGSVEEMLKTSISHAPGNVAERLKRTHKRLTEQRILISKAVDDAPSKNLLGPTQNYANALNETLGWMFDVSREYQGPPASTYNQLRGEIGTAWSYFAKLRQELDQILRYDKIPAPVRGRLATHRWDTKADTWKTYGDWEEARPDADAYFIQDLRLLALTLATLRGDAIAVVPQKEREPVLQKLNTVDQNFRVVESAHDLSELALGLDLLAAAEKWEASAGRSRTSNPVDWNWLLERLRQSPGDLARTGPSDAETRKVIQAAQNLLAQAQNEPATRNVINEMNQRFSRDRQPVAVADDTRRLAERVRAALELLRPAVQKAREQLAALTPKLAERMAQLAKEAEELKQRSEEQAIAQPTSEDAAKADTQQQLAEQQRLNQDLETVKDALRSDAQRQDLMKEDGRDRARDADDALAMLREPPVQAEKALQEAAKKDKPEERATALKTAGEEQQKLAQALDELAKHYDALEKGEAADTRLALRDQEKKLGVKEQLDRQYEMAEKLAEAQEGSPEEMLKKLEAALPRNPLMRQELSSVSKNALQNATQKLGEASKQEQQVSDSVKKLAAEQQPPPPQNTPNPSQNSQNPPQAAQNKPNPSQNSQNPTPAQPTPPQQSNPQLAEAAKQQTPIANSAAVAGEDVERAGRHEERLNNKMAGHELQQLGLQVQQTATADVPKARDALAAAKAAQEAQPALGAANENLQRQLAQLSEAATNAPKRAFIPTDPEHADAALPADPAKANAAIPSDPSKANAASPSDAAKPNASVPSQPSPNSQAAKTAAQPTASPSSSSSSSSSTAAAQPPSPQMASAQMPAKPADPTASPHGDPTAEMTDFTSLPPPTSTASPQQQVWMARALDSLDAALHTKNNNQQPGDENQAGQQQQSAQKGQQGKDGQQDPNSQSMSQAQQAMAAAAQAQAAAMRSARTPPPNGEKPMTAKGGMQADSKTGAQANGNADAYGALPSAKTLSEGDWGKLPKKMAEQLTQGQRETTSSEYRKQIETYYRVIAEKANKQ
jgi:hypothetical protein